MKKLSLILAALLLILTLLPALSTFADNGWYTVKASDGTAKYLTQAIKNRKNYWSPSSDTSTVTITVKSGRYTDGIYIGWYDPESVFTITAYNKSGKVVKTYENGDLYDGYSCFYPLDTSTRKIEILMPSSGNKEYGIYYLELSDAKAENPAIKRWEDPKEHCDLLVVATHQDDEFIYMGGIIPKYIDQGYTVALAYTSICSRLRVEEGLCGIWHSGIHTYPDFMGYPDLGRKETFEEAADVWGGFDNVVRSYVRELRARRPKVVVTHDINGEKRVHNSHRVTSYALQEAVGLAKDETYDPESVALYGTWQVSKLYLHLYDKYQIKLDYNKPLESYNGKTAYEVATEGYAFHVSQHRSYQMNDPDMLPGGIYDNTLFGLFFSTVGYDTEDFFFNIPKDSEEPKDPDEPDTPEPPTVTTTPEPATTPQTSPPETAPPTVTTTTTGGNTPALPEVTTLPTVNTQKPDPNTDRTERSDDGDEESHLSPAAFAVLGIIVTLSVVSIVVVRVLIKKFKF